jgi:hypothetical protein
LTNNRSIPTPSAVDLRPVITPFGRRFLMYVLESEFPKALIAPREGWPLVR